LVSLALEKTFGPMSLFHFFNTQTMHFESKHKTTLLCFPYKPFTLAGFAPGSAVPEAAAMSTAPLRQDKLLV
jgi:hypothetical protein